MQKIKKEESRKRLEKIKADAKAEADRRAAIAAQKKEAEKRSIAEAEAKKVKQELEEMRALQALKEVIKPKQPKADVVQMTEAKAKQYNNVKGVKRKRAKAIKLAEAARKAENRELESVGIVYLKGEIGCGEPLAYEIQDLLVDKGFAYFEGKQCKLKAEYMKQAKQA